MGKTAGLPAPFNDAQQVKYGKILGLQICTNTSQNEMVKERLQKAQNAWNIGQKYFLNTKTNKKYRIQLYNACIKPILQYGMITQEITDVNIKKMQQKFSKMLRKIEEKEAWQKLDRTKDDDEKRIKQKKNSNIRSKKTNSITYHTLKKQNGPRNTINTR